MCLLVACSFEDRKIDEDDRTATSTNVVIERPDGIREELNFLLLEHDEVGINPLAFTVKDMNTDTIPDIVLLNNAEDEEDQGFLILQGTGITTPTDAEDLFTFALAITSNMDQPQSLIVEDFDLDGAQDIAIVNTDDDLLRIWSGDDSGSFQIDSTSQSIEVGELPIYLVAGEWEPDRFDDGQPRLSIATANVGDNDLSIIFNNGMGFETDGITTDDILEINDDQGVSRAPIQLTTGHYWKSETEIDNRYLDIAVLSENKERVEILGNIPQEVDGIASTNRRTFDKMVEVDVGDRPQALITGDWDGDGHADFAVTNQNDDDVTLIYGDSIGNFVSWDIRVGRSPGQIAAGDLNTDGIVDFVVGNLFDGDLTVLLSNGNGTRPDAPNRAYSRSDIASGSIPAGSRPSFITVADINGDNQLDILTTIPFENRLSLLLRQ